MAPTKAFLYCYALHSAITSAIALPPQQPLLPHQTPPATTSESSPNLPLVIWHGLGDNYDSDGMNSLHTLINKTIGPTYTYNIRVDPDPSTDRTATYLGNLTEEIASVCASLATHPILSRAPAINALGFSQGGQFMRAYVERCNTPPVANLVTFGAQHNGISEFQTCKERDWLCETWDGFLKSNTWGTFAQNKLVPAQYFRDPDDLENYLEYSNFLADVNNERAVKNATYKENLGRLEKFVMFVFSEDTVVVPKESAWFGEKNSTQGDGRKVREREIYKEDWIGLRGLDEGGRLVFEVAEGGHMQIGEEVLVDVMRKYFRR